MKPKLLCVHDGDRMEDLSNKKVEVPIAQLQISAPAARAVRAVRAARGARVAPAAPATTVKKNKVNGIVADDDCM